MSEIYEIERDCNKKGCLDPNIKLRTYPQIIYTHLTSSFPAVFVAFPCRTTRYACKKAPCLPKNLTVQSARILFTDKFLILI